MRTAASVARAALAGILDCLHDGDMPAVGGIVQDSLVSRSYVRLAHEIQAAYEIGTEPIALAPDVTPEHILQFFAFGHLPPHLREVSEPFADLAFAIMQLPRNPERTVALRKLLEAKDAAVRAKLADQGDR